MDILLKGVTVIDPSSPFHLQSTDLLIKNGLIAQSGDISGGADKVIDIPGLHVSPGWVDVFSHFCDPGFEHRETLESGSQAAAAGGFSDVFILPNTAPVLDHRSVIEYLVQKSKALPVTVHPLGAITKNAAGKELAEMYDMYDNGAIAFSDGLAPLQAAGVLLKALQYLKAIDGIIIQIPNDEGISAHGQMNESITSTQLGLGGIPAIAEEIIIARDIELAKYTNASLHFTGISTARSVALISAAKKEGLSITCSVTPYHLYFTEEDLYKYDTHLKVSPPLRTAADRDALRQAVVDGIIDCIATHHLPQHADEKIVEFEYAKNGMIGLETAYAVVKAAIPSLTNEQLQLLFSTNARKIFGLPSASIQLNQAACISLYQPSATWEANSFLSRSKNSAFTGTTFKGKPIGIINADQVFLRP